MDPEKEEKKQDSLEQSRMKRMGRDLFKKPINKFMMTVRKIAAIIAALPMIIKLALIIVIISIFVTFMSTIDDIFGSNDAASDASMNVLRNEVSIQDSTSGEGYYFKINSDIIDKYVKETFDSKENSNPESYLPTNGENNNDQISSEIDDGDKKEYDEEEEKKTRKQLEDWFGTEEFDEYMVKMLRAEIASTYPKLGEYIGANGTEDKQGNKKDSEGNYVGQGIIEIHRTKMNQDGTAGAESMLTYLPHENFTALVTANDPSALNYFAFDPNTGLLYYATYREVIITVDGVETSRTYTLQESNVSYKALTSMCSMPYNFLFSLLQRSNNANYLMAVIDLLLEDSKVVLMIQDQLSVTIYTEINRQVEKTETQELTGHTDRYRNSQGETEVDHYWSYGAINTSYDFPAGDTETIVTTTYTNTANVYIKEATTWCMDFEQDVTLNVADTPGEEVLAEHSESEYSGLSYYLISSNKGSIPSPREGKHFTIIEKFLSNEKLLYSTKLDTKNYTWTTSITTEKTINYERFLGLWKNDTGKYYSGCLFDPNGKKVEYKPLDGDAENDTVVDNIAEKQGQTIDTLINLLAMHEDTQTHEELMKYYWNIYYGEEIYDVDLDALLDLFNTSGFISLSGGSIYGSSVEEKVWFALIDAGYSEYAAAGAMGNIWRESGFRTNNLENSKETTLGMNDEEYTAKVDDGTYLGFTSDSAGYGLCQWTTSGRKSGLLTYVQNKGVSISDENAQIEYLLAELGVSNSASSLANYNLLSYNGYNADSWINADSIEEAATAFCWSFERPGKSSAGLETRISQAESYYNRFHGQKRPTYDVDSVTVGSYTFPHYLQKNYSGSYGTSTIASAGCGPTSLAMILSGLLRDSSIDPVSVVANIKDYWPNGSYYVAGTGSSHCIFRSDFLLKYYGVTSIMYPTESQALKALDEGYPVIAGETGHLLAILPVSSELKAEGYKFYILDSARGHSGPYKSVADANAVVQGSLKFDAIIKP